MHVELLSINFKTNSYEQQARIILDKVSEIHKTHPLIKVGITYSANQQQTAKIASTYLNGDWQTGTSGANQAHVISLVETLLANKYRDLQTVFRIIPITTIDYDKQGYTARDADVKTSLENASQFIADGNYLLGWSNQLTPNSVAIGGGVAAAYQTPKQVEMIEQWIQAAFFTKPGVEQDKSIKQLATSSAATNSRTPSSDQPIVASRLTRQADLVLSSKKKTIEAVTLILEQFTQDIKAANIECIKASQALNTILFKISASKSSFFEKLDQLDIHNIEAPQRFKAECAAFKLECDGIIKQHCAVLKNEPKWNDYLINLLKQIANAIVFILSFGQKERFFAITTAHDTADVSTQCDHLNVAIGKIDI